MSDAKAAYDAIMACRNDSGKLAKEAIIRKQEKNGFLKEFLRLTYEPKVNFYMTEIDTSITAVVKGTPVMSETFIETVRRLLHEREITGHRARAHIATLYNSFKHDWERELLVMLIARDVRAGFNISTINKVWPDLITDVPYMRCCLPKDAKLDKFPWKDGVFSEIKADGMFANVSNVGGDNDVVSIESRSGSPFPLDAFEEIVAEVREYMPDRYQSHGELMMMRNGVILPRQEGNGLFNKLLQGSEIPDDCVPVYHAWDMIPLDEAKVKNKYKRPYKERFEHLKKTFKGAKHIAVIEHEVVHSLKEAYVHYQKALARGLEGTIVKHPDMIWEDSTSKFQVKLKLEFECDLRIVGFVPGKGKNKGLIGSIQCESEDGKLKVDVPGFTDDLRKEITKNWDKQWLGGIITVTSNSIMPPTNKAYYSLFLPRFVERRLDKTKADTLKRIQDQYEAAIESVAEIA